LARKISILTGNHLSHNPRVIKEATALADAGFETTVLGGWVDRRLKALDIELLQSVPFTFRPVIDITGGGLARLAVRARRRISQSVFTTTGVGTVAQLGYAGPELCNVASRIRSDLSIAHSEAALVAADRLMDSGNRVGVDMEDWFSQDLPEEARRTRPTTWLSELERRLLHGHHATCTSHAMSEALSREYKCSPPSVIYNAFAWSDRRAIDNRPSDRRRRDTPSIHWYSQTLGPGRGLEDLLNALAFLPHTVQLHLRGRAVGGFVDWIRKRATTLPRVELHIHSLVSNDELLSRVAEHDIGFAGEVLSSQNKQVTVSNKMLHYFLAGLAVIASDTIGQLEVAKLAPDAVRTYVCGNPRALADALGWWLDNPQLLARAKRASLSAAHDTFCWERQADRLIARVEQALACRLAA
jgi:glycosyltransferase involved in cell wall biosynthesis